MEFFPTYNYSKDVRNCETAFELCKCFSHRYQRQIFIDRLINRSKDYATKTKALKTVFANNLGKSRLSTDLKKTSVRLSNLKSTPKFYVNF